MFIRSTTDCAGARRGKRVLRVTATELQAWLAGFAALATGLLGILRYFSYKTRRDRITVVGQAFSQTVDGLSSDTVTKQLAAAVLLRRFFDSGTEQGAAGTPYEREAVAVIAALLRNTPEGELQKLLADGLAYASSLYAADLQGCNLSNAYLGKRPRATVIHGTSRLLHRKGWITRGSNHMVDDVSHSSVDLSSADLFEATLSGTSFRGATAREAVFFGCEAYGAVFERAHLEGANFRHAKLDGARFAGAWIEGANFEGAEGVPTNVEYLLGPDGIIPPAVGMPVGPP